MEVDMKRKPNYNKMVEQLDYNLDTGIFTWKVDKNQNVKVGSVAGRIDNQGYLRITFDRKEYPAHRLAMYHIHKYWSENKIDHIDRNKLNNKIENLREVSEICSVRNRGEFSNNTSGVKGVCWFKDRNKWHGFITNNYKRISLGFYKDFIEAVFARLAGEQALGWKGCDANSPAYQYLKQINLL